VKVADYAGSARDDGSVFTIGNKAYCVTGSDGSQCTRDGYVYDGPNDYWSAMASLPAGQERQYATAFSYSNTGYMLTGITCNNVCLNDFWMYNTAANTWSALPNFPGQIRQGACNFVIGNKAYIIGGRNTSGNVFNDVWEYNITTAQWTQKNNLPFAGMFRGSAFQINGTGYVCFGLTNNSNFNRSIYSYDPLNDQWALIPNINLPARNYVGCAITSNKAFLYGGQDSLYQITNDMRLFDPTTNSVTIYSGIPGLGRKGGMSFSLNNFFYISTGVDASPARIRETWRNDQFVGLAQFEKIKPTVEIYPNPASDRILIDAQKLKCVIIRNYLGQIVMEVDCARKTIPFSNSVDISPLASSVYNISVITEDGIFLKKLIIQR
jgi:N-acetylneuraminic acid mutarotase